MRQSGNQRPGQLRPLPARRLSPEQIVLFLGLLSFFFFLWLVGFLLSSLTVGSDPVAFKPFWATVMPGFVLPPTWTPSPTRQLMPSPLSTHVAYGVIPTRLYTPQPTTLPGIPMPQIMPRLTVLDLARIMQGESPGDLEAAYYVGWVAKNRLLHPGYGDTYAVVSYGFFGYRADLQPSREFLALARQVIRSNQDPTGGCLYALSRTDITKLGVPSGRADVAYGEWFFFRTWPLSGR
ncbi:MAG: hypothetical protein AB1801_08620 [Chloroflexota bacterium]